MIIRIELIQVNPTASPCFYPSIFTLSADFHVHLRSEVAVTFEQERLVL